MFAIFYGSLDDSIPFPFLSLFKLQIPLGNDYFPIALCWVFAFCPMCMCEQDKLVWPPIASTLNLSRWLKRLGIVNFTWPLQVLQPNSSHWRRASSFPLTLQSCQPAHGCCMSLWPSLQLESLRAQFCCLQQPFLNHNLTEEFQSL